MANPFDVRPAAADLTPVMTGIGNIIKQNRAEAKRQAGIKEMGDVLQSGDPMKIAEFSSKNPELRGQLKDAFGFTNRASEQAARDTYKRVLSDPDNAPQYLQEGIQQVIDAGGTPTTMTSDFDMFSQNPEGALKAIKAGYAGLDPTGYKTLFGREGGQSGLPSTVQEWQYFDNLSKGDQKRFMELKRQTNQVTNIGGVPTVTSTLPEVANRPLSTLEAEKSGQADIAAAKEEATGAVKGRQQRLNTLRTAKAGRQANISKAEKFLKLLKAGEIKTGAGRKAASYIPGVYTKQGQLDEEFNAFAEIAARQALKASGELKPTDADVEGMKRAMFGIGRDETVNINLLEDFLRQQRADEEEYFNLLSGRNTPIETQAEKPKIEDLTDTDLDNMTLEELEALQ